MVSSAVGHSSHRYSHRYHLIHLLANQYFGRSGLGGVGRDVATWLTLEDSYRIWYNKGYLAPRNIVHYLWRIVLPLRKVTQKDKEPKSIVCYNHFRRKVVVFSL